MAKITYKLLPFSPNKAAAGALCVVLGKDAVIEHKEEEDFISNVRIDDNKEIPTTGFIGTGICRIVSENRYSIIIGSKSYIFDSYGNDIFIKKQEGDKPDYTVKLGEVQDAVTSTGDVVASSTTTVTTRGTKPEGGEEWTVKIEDGGDTTVSSLNARDQFAIHALRGMLSRIPDPSVLSDNEMNFYCNAAYQWAANMMTAAANSRATLAVEKEEGEETDVADNVEYTEVQIPENNTEKFLNNIVYALQRTDAIVDTYEDDSDNNKKTNIYAERVTLSKVDMEGLDSLIKQQRGAHTVGEGEQAKEEFYNESLFEHYLREAITAYLNHTPAQGEPETKTTVGLDDLINAVKSLKEEEGGGGSANANKQIAIYQYRNMAEAKADGWKWNNNIWSKDGYDNVSGAETDAVAKTLPTWKYVVKVSIVELPALTAQLKRVADALTNNNS